MRFAGRKGRGLSRPRERPGRKKGGSRVSKPAKKEETQGGGGPFPKGGNRGKRAGLRGARKKGSSILVL